jgi:hypothetical protein
MSSDATSIEKNSKEKLSDFPASTNPPKNLVFISYTRGNENLVLPIVKQLETRGVEVWVDQWSIPKGADWDLAIDAALAGCACMLVFLSPAAVASEEVRGELRTAQDLSKPIVPVVLRRCDIPRRLRLTQHVDLSSGELDVPDGIDRLMAALQDAMSPEVPRTDTKHKVTASETRIRKVRAWAQARPFYFLAPAFMPLAFATGHLFRLPVEGARLPAYVFLGTGMVCAIAFWIRSRLGAILLAASIGVAFVLKPLLVPVEGFGDWRTFPYDSATSRDYWLPGGFFLGVAVIIVLISNWPRLAQDFRRLRPSIAAVLIMAAAALGSYAHFSRPTLYDVYLPFRPKYGELRQHLKSISAALDNIPAPVRLSRTLDIPLVLDEARHTRSEDPTTTGHFFLYQNLTDPDRDFGEIKYEFDDDLRLNIRDTGPDPVLLVFDEFASDLDTRHLEAVINAPYLVVVKPLRLDKTHNVDNKDFNRVGPYRVFLYHLKRDEVLFADDIHTALNTASDLKEAVNKLLDRSVGAKILR